MTTLLNIRGHVIKTAVLLVIGACMSSAIPVHAESEKSELQFQKVSDEYLDNVYFFYQPVDGTTAGYHQYDTRLEDFSQKSINAEIAALKIGRASCRERV